LATAGDLMARLSEHSLPFGLLLNFVIGRWQGHNHPIVRLNRSSRYVYNLWKSRTPLTLNADTARSS